MIKIENKDALSLISDLKQQGIPFIIVTGPPFNINYHYEQYKDKMNEDDYYNFLKSVFEGQRFVCIHYPEALHKLSIKLGQAPVRVVSWVYNSNTAKQHRDIAFYGIKPDFNKVKQPYKNPNDKRIKERIARGLTGCKLYDWWNINQVKNVSKKKINHPCVMPLEVMENIIGILPKDILIVDPFLGSGTTALACQELGRDFIGCDIDNNYCQIAKNRLKGITQLIKAKSYERIKLF